MEIIEPKTLKAEVLAKAYGTLNCQYCESENVKLLDIAGIDDHGVIFKIKCLDCRRIGEDGDEDLFDHYYITPDGNRIPKA